MLFLAGGLAVVGVLALFAVTMSQAGVEVRGDVSVPYDTRTVKEVRVLDTLTLKVDEESQPTTGTTIGIALLILATAAFMTAIVLRMIGRRGRLVTFYTVIGAGVSFAAFDELFAIHETVGHNLQFLADIPGITRPDDALIALYVVPAAAFVFYFRDVLMRNRRAALALATAIGFFALSAIADITSHMNIESAMEVISGACITAGLVLLMRADLLSNLRPSEAPDEEVKVVDQRMRSVQGAREAPGAGLEPTAR